MNQFFDETHKPDSPTFTDKQGQYLAFIWAYTCINRRPPAEADMQRHFNVTAPAIHQMVITLDRLGLIKRLQGVPRSIHITINPDALPVLKPAVS